VIPPLVAVPAGENDQTRPGVLFGSKPERNFLWFRVSATLNVRGLAFPIRPAFVVRRHLIGCSYLFIAPW